MTTKTFFTVTPDNRYQIKRLETRELLYTSATHASYEEARDAALLEIAKYTQALTPAQPAPSAPQADPKPVYSAPITKPATDKDGLINFVQQIINEIEAGRPQEALYYAVDLLNDLPRAAFTWNPSETAQPADPEPAPQAPQPAPSAPQAAAAVKPADYVPAITDRPNTIHLGKGKDRAEYTVKALQLDGEIHGQPVIIFAGPNDFSTPRLRPVGITPHKYNTKPARTPADKWLKEATDESRPALATPHGQWASDGRQLRHILGDGNRIKCECPHCKGKTDFDTPDFTQILSPQLRAEYKAGLTVKRADLLRACYQAEAIHRNPNPAEKGWNNNKVIQLITSEAEELSYQADSEAGRISGTYPHGDRAPRRHDPGRPRAPLQTKTTRKPRKGISKIRRIKAMKNYFAQEAARLLKAYMRMIAREAGMRWDSDNDSEVEFIVDRIMDAVTDEIKQAMKETNDKIKGLSDQIARLEGVE